MSINTSGLNYSILGNGSCVCNSRLRSDLASFEANSKDKNKSEDAKSYIELL